MASASDVPGKYDLIVNGSGYLLLDALTPNIPFRTHRAIYTYTPTFLERTNVSGAYGDNQQDFFLTASQNDWSEGEQQRFFRSTDKDSIHQYWAGTNIDISTPGQVTLANKVTSLTFAGSVIGACADPTLNGTIWAVTSTNLYQVDAAGTITDKGAHGAGTPNGPRAICSDGSNIFIAGSSAIRKWAGSAFSTFSATTTAAELVFLNNTLYSGDGSSGLSNRLAHYDTSGVQTIDYTWKTADGLGLSVYQPMAAFGGKLLIARQFQANGGDLWLFDGTAPERVAVFDNFQPWSIAVVNGIACIGGAFLTGSNPSYESAVFYYTSGGEGLLWRSKDTSFTNVNYSTVGAFHGGLVFTDEVHGNLMFWDPPTGSISTVGTFTKNAATFRNVLASGRASVLLGFNSTTGYLYAGGTAKATSGTVKSSLYDFDNSLTKTFRGIKVEWEAATDGDGGSVDIAYQVNSVDGNYTNLQTGATSGTEYTLSAVTGRSISVQVTLNKGTSTLGPKLKRVYVRAAPILQTFRKREYIVDLTGAAPDAPRLCRDGTSYTTVPFDGVNNLVTAAASTSPISITDRLGTFTGIVEPDGFEVYEMHAQQQQPAKSGSYVVKVTVREV